jgi:hypothetical protein
MPKAIRAVSPGSGIPNDSSITTVKSSGRPWLVKKCVKVRRLFAG